MFCQLSPVFDDNITNMVAMSYRNVQVTFHVLKAQKN